MSKLGNFVWGIADQLRGVYKPHQYGGVILPFTILRRLDCILAPTRVCRLGRGRVDGCRTARRGRLLLVGYRHGWCGEVGDVVGDLDTCGAGVNPKSAPRGFGAFGGDECRLTASEGA